MAVNSTRSQNTSLAEGATDGKYRKIRPDTELYSTYGASLTMLDKSHLSQFWYGTAAQQIPDKTMAVPGR